MEDENLVIGFDPIGINLTNGQHEITLTDLDNQRL